MELQRRSFIKYASLAAAGNLAGLRPFGAMNAFASTGSDYKALVCVFLFGGNDGNNMVIPYDTQGYANYASLRGPIALAQNSLLPLTPLPNFALHPSLPEMQSLFNSGSAALVANVGTLVQPLTRAEYLSGSSVPTNLFSHSDQQNEWQSAAPNWISTTGWGGRLSDALNGSYNASSSIPMITSVAGDTVFCNGVATTPLAISPGVPTTSYCSEGTQCSSREATAQILVKLGSGVSLVTADQGITANAYNYSATLKAATSSMSPLQTVFPGSPMGAQMKQIAQVIQARASLGAGRQIFFCGVGNFDTHANQLATQSQLLTNLSAALSAFYQATQEMNVANEVTAFTMSDFGRSFQPNSNTGSDHAWGSHHMVVGGAVKGGHMYGTFPTLALGGPDDSGANGRWIPTISSVQYAATLGQWFGLPASQLGQIFPNIGNFTNTKLGFL